MSVELYLLLVVVRERRRGGEANLTGALSGEEKVGRGVEECWVIPTTTTCLVTRVAIPAAPQTPLCGPTPGTQWMVCHSCGCHSWATFTPMWRS